MKKRLLVLLDKRINDKVIINNELLKNFKLRTIIEDYKDYDIYFICPIRDYYVLTMAFKINKKKIVYYKNEDEIINILKKRFLDMKFDKVIMNPPFSDDLHLKILKEVIKNCGENCEIVCLQPDYLSEKLFWDKNKKINKYEKYLNGKLDYVEEINSKGLFDAAFNYNLIISIYKSNGGNFDYYSRTPKNNKLVSKLILQNKTSDLRTACLNTDKNYKLVFPGVHGHFGTTDWFEITADDYNIALNVTPQKTNKYYEKQVISFDTEIERKNFFDSLFTTFYMYCVSLVKTMNAANYLKYLPFMEDYTQPWTNERFCNHFGITGFISDTEAEPGSEWEEILNAMKEYM